MTNNEEFEKILENIDENGPEPQEEPQRQYYFIKKTRALVKKMSEELGRPLIASTVTFGCQMNARDSEKLIGILEKNSEPYERSFRWMQCCAENQLKITA